MNCAGFGRFASSSQDDSLPAKYFIISSWDDEVFLPKNTVSLLDEDLFLTGFTLSSRDDSMSGNNFMLSSGDDNVLENNFISLTDAENKYLLAVPHSVKVMKRLSRIIQVNSTCKKKTCKIIVRTSRLFVASGERGYIIKSPNSVCR